MCAGVNILEVAFLTYDMDNMQRLWIEYWREQGKRPDVDVPPYGFINDMLVENPDLESLNRGYFPIVVSESLGLPPCDPQLALGRRNAIEENRGRQ